MAKKATKKKAAPKKKAVAKKKQLQRKKLLRKLQRNLLRRSNKKAPLSGVFLWI